MKILVYPLDSEPISEQYLDLYNLINIKLPKAAKESEEKIQRQ